MKSTRFRISAVFAALLTATFLQSLRADDDVQGQEEQAMKEAVEVAAPSVVRIETFGGLERVGKLLVGTGPTTGLIVSEDGYIISSAFNFVQQPTSILVTLPSGGRAAAKIVARDEARMLVLLHVKTDEKLPVPKSVPREEMVVGQWTIAIGRTYEKGRPNMSVGILSASNRIWGKAIQTDAKISPSNYGGPLIDIQGRVLGVLVPLSPQAQGEIAGAEWYDSGIGFAVPLAEILPYLDRMKEGTDLKPGILGISLKPGDIYSLPAEVVACQPKSPAYEAGIKAGDVITEVDGQPIARQAQLRHALGRKYAGDSVKFVATRGEEKIEATVELTDKLEPYVNPFLGVLPRRDAGQTALKVRFVYPDSPAAKAGIKVDDQISEINAQAIGDVESAQQALASFEPQGQVKVKVQRGDQSLEMEIELVGLPTDVLDEIPAARADVEKAGEQPAVGEVEIKLPEEKNECVAYVPESYHPDVAYGLVVWLHAPGGFDKEKLIARWKERCEANDLILLAPQSADPAKWLPTELDFIGKTIDDVIGKYNIDRTRVVAHGYQAGGAMSYLLAFTQRELIRGVAVVDAAVPARAGIPANDPVMRLAVFSASSAESPQAKRIDAGTKRIADTKYPVTVRETPGKARYLNDAEVDELVRWIDSLDRF